MLKHLLLMREIDTNGLDLPPKHEPASTEGMKRIFEEWGEGPEKAFNDPKISAFGVSLSDNFRIPGKYRLAVIFPFSPDPSPIFLGEWDSARCNEFTMYSAAYEHYASAA